MGDAAHKNAKVSQRISQFHIITTVNSDRPHIGGQEALSSITHTLPINALRYWYLDCHVWSVSNAHIHKPQIKYSTHAVA